MAKQEIERLGNNSAASDQAIGQTELERTLAKFHELILDGLRHGFFEFTITCEIIKDRKREVTIRAGKSYRNIIPADELTD